MLTGLALWCATFWSRTMGKPLPQTANRRRPVVLAVDDNWGLLQFLEEHYEVLTVCDGHAALDVVRSRQVDAVLLDILMPGIDGLEVLGRMKATDPGLAVILISGLKDTPLVVSGMNLGACDYLTKPFEEERVLAALARAIEYRRTNQRAALLIGNDAAVLASFAIVLSRHMSVITAPPELTQLSGPVRGMPVLILYDDDSAPDPAADFVQSLRKRFAGSAFIILTPEVDRATALRERAALTSDQLVTKPYRLDEVLHRIARFVPSLNQLSAFGSRLGSRVTTLIDHVSQTHHRPLEASELARAVGLSVDRLAHLVRDRLGVSLMEYVTRFRVEVARHLIAVTDLPLEEIADRAGFASASHLSRVFLHHTGHRPGAYRRLTRWTAP